MRKVLIAPATLDKADFPYLQIIQDAGLEPVFPRRGSQLAEEELLADLPGCEASVAGSEPYTARVLAACPGLRVIARVGVGYDAVDVAAATARGIAVTIAPGTNQGAVAEHTFGLILGLAKNLALGKTATASFSTSSPASQATSPANAVDGYTISGSPVTSGAYVGTSTGRGVFRLTSAQSSTLGRGSPAAKAMAGTWSRRLVEPPKAAWTVMAFRTEAGERMTRARG